MEELIGLLKPDLPEELRVGFEAENQAGGQSPAKKQRTEAWGYGNDGAS